MRLTGSRSYYVPPPPKMPPGLVELIEGLTKEVLKHNPTDIYSFCAGHVEQLLEKRDGPSNKQLLSLEEKIARVQKKVRQTTELRRQEYDKNVQIHTSKSDKLTLHVPQLVSLSDSSADVDDNSKSSQNEIVNNIPKPHQEQALENSSEEEISQESLGLFKKDDIIDVIALKDENNKIASPGNEVTSLLSNSPDNETKNEGAMKPTSNDIPAILSVSSIADANDFHIKSSDNKQEDPIPSETSETENIQVITFTNNIPSSILHGPATAIEQSKYFHIEGGDNQENHSQIRAPETANKQVVTKQEDPIPSKTSETENIQVIKFTNNIPSSIVHGSATAIEQSKYFHIEGGDNQENHSQIRTPETANKQVVTKQEDPIPSKTSETENIQVTTLTNNIPSSIVHGPATAIEQSKYFHIEGGDNQENQLQIGTPETTNKQVVIFTNDSLLPVLSDPTIVFEHSNKVKKDDMHTESNAQQDPLPSVVVADPKSKYEQFVESTGTGISTVISIPSITIDQSNDIESNDFRTKSDGETDRQLSGSADPIKLNIPKNIEKAEQIALLRENESTAQVVVEDHMQKHTDNETTIGTKTDANCNIPNLDVFTAGVKNPALKRADIERNMNTLKPANDPEGENSNNMDMIPRAHVPSFTDGKDIHTSKTTEQTAKIVEQIQQSNEIDIIHADKPLTNTKNVQYLNNDEIKTVPDSQLNNSSVIHDIISGKDNPKPEINDSTELVNETPPTQNLNINDVSNDNKNTEHKHGNLTRRADGSTILEPEIHFDSDIQTLVTENMSNNAPTIKESIRNIKEIEAPAHNVLMTQVLKDNVDVDTDIIGTDGLPNSTQIDLKNNFTYPIGSFSDETYNTEARSDEINKDEQMTTDFSQNSLNDNPVSNNMDLETAAVTIQKVFRNFLFKSRGSTFEDTHNDEPDFMDEDDKNKEEHDFSIASAINIDRRALGITRMDTVLQTVNEEKSLSLSDDSSTLSSAATIIQAHVRGFLVRNRLNSNKTISTNSLAASNSNEPSLTSLEVDNDQNKNKTVLNIHIVPEGENYLSREESLITSMELSLDSSPPSSINLHPLGYDKSERRKRFKREDAIQSISPPSNHSGKLSEDLDYVKELSHDNDIVAEHKVTNTNNTTEDLFKEKGKIITTVNIALDTVLNSNEDIADNIKNKIDTSAKRKSLMKMNSDELDVVTPFISNESSALIHTGEFHDAALPTTVSRCDTSVVSEFKNVLVYFLLWNHT